MYIHYICIFEPQIMEVLKISSHYSMAEKFTIETHFFLLSSLKSLLILALFFSIFLEAF